MAVIVKFDVARAISNANAYPTQVKVAEQVIAMMKEFIAKGISPVGGEGRFEPYKAQAKKTVFQKQARALSTKAKKLKKNGVVSFVFRNQIAKLTTEAKAARSSAKSVRGYPFTIQKRFPNKKARPVNLSIDGTMLNAIKFIGVGKKIRIGIFDKRQALKAETHNEGTQVPKVPQRRFIPTGKNQKFVVSIMRAIRTIYEQALSDIIELTNK